MCEISSNHILSVTWVIAARARQWAAEFASLHTWITWKDHREHIIQIRCPRWSAQIYWESNYLNWSRLQSASHRLHKDNLKRSNFYDEYNRMDSCHASAIVGSMLIEVVVLWTANTFPSLPRLGGFPVRENSKILLQLWSDQTSWQRNLYWTK